MKKPSSNDQSNVSKRTNKTLSREKRIATNNLNNIGIRGRVTDKLDNEINQDLQKLQQEAKLKDDNSFKQKRVVKSPKVVLNKADFKKNFEKQKVFLCNADIDKNLKEEIIQLNSARTFEKKVKKFKKDKNTNHSNVKKLINIENKTLGKKMVLQSAVNVNKQLSTNNEKVRKNQSSEKINNEIKLSNIDRNLLKKDKTQLQNSSEKNNCQLVTKHQSKQSNVIKTKKPSQLIGSNTSNKLDTKKIKLSLNSKRSKFKQTSEETSVFKENTRERTTANSNVNFVSNMSFNSKSRIFSPKSPGISILTDKKGMFSIEDKFRSKTPTYRSHVMSKDFNLLNNYASIVNNNINNKVIDKKKKVNVQPKKRNKSPGVVVSSNVNREKPNDRSRLAIVKTRKTEDLCYNYVSSDVEMSESRQKHKRDNSNNLAKTFYNMGMFEKEAKKAIKEDRKLFKQRLLNFKQSITEKNKKSLKNSPNIHSYNPEVKTPIKKNTTTPDVFNVNKAFDKNLWSNSNYKQRKNKSIDKTKKSIINSYEKKNSLNYNHLSHRVVSKNTYKRNNDIQNSVFLNDKKNNNIFNPNFKNKSIFNTYDENFSKNASKKLKINKKDCLTFDAKKSAREKVYATNILHDKFSDKDIASAAATFIQKNIRGYLVRKRLLETYEEFLLKNENFKKNGITYGSLETNPFSDEIVRTKELHNFKKGKNYQTNFNAENNHQKILFENSAKKENFHSREHDRLVYTNQKTQSIVKGNLTSLWNSESYQYSHDVRSTEQFSSFEPRNFAKSNEYITSTNQKSKGNSTVGKNKEFGKKFITLEDDFLTKNPNKVPDNYVFNYKFKNEVINKKIGKNPERLQKNKTDIININGVKGIIAPETFNRTNNVHNYNSPILIKSPNDFNSYLNSIETSNDKDQVILTCNKTKTTNINKDFENPDNIMLTRNKKDTVFTSTNEFLTIQKPNTAQMTSTNYKNDIINFENIYDIDSANIDFDNVQYMSKLQKSLQFTGSNDSINYMTSNKNSNYKNERHRTNEGLFNVDNNYVKDKNHVIIFKGPYDKNNTTKTPTNKKNNAENFSGKQTSKLITSTNVNNSICKNSKNQLVNDYLKTPQDKINLMNNMKTPQSQKNKVLVDNSMAKSSSCKIVNQANLEDKHTKKTSEINLNKNEKQVDQKVKQIITNEKDQKNQDTIKNSYLKNKNEKIPELKQPNEANLLLQNKIEKIQENTKSIEKKNKGAEKIDLSQKKIPKEINLKMFAKEEFKRWEEISTILKNFESYGQNNKGFEEMFKKINNFSEGAKKELANKFEITNDNRSSPCTNKSIVKLSIENYSNYNFRYNKKQKEDSKDAKAENIDDEIYCDEVLNQPVDAFSKNKSKNSEPEGKLLLNIYNKTEPISNDLNNKNKPENYKKLFRTNPLSSKANNVKPNNDSQKLSATNSYGESNHQFNMLQRKNPNNYSSSPEIKTNTKTLNFSVKVNPRGDLFSEAHIKGKNQINSSRESNHLNVGSDYSYISKNNFNRESMENNPNKKNKIQQKDVLEKWVNTNTRKINTIDVEIDDMFSCSAKDVFSPLVSKNRNSSELFKVFDQKMECKIDKIKRENKDIEILHLSRSLKLHKGMELIDEQLKSSNTYNRQILSAKISKSWESSDDNVTKHDKSPIWVMREDDFADSVKSIVKIIKVPSPNIENHEISKRILSTSGNEIRFENYSSLNSPIINSGSNLDLYDKSFSNSEHRFKNSNKQFRDNLYINDIYENHNKQTDEYKKIDSSHNEKYDNNFMSPPSNNQQKIRSFKNEIESIDMSFDPYNKSKSQNSIKSHEILNKIKFSSPNNISKESTLIQKEFYLNDHNEKLYENLGQNNNKNGNEYTYINNKKIEVIFTDKDKEYKQQSSNKSLQSPDRNIMQAANLVISEITEEQKNLSNQNKILAKNEENFNDYLEGNFLKESVSYCFEDFMGTSKEDSNMRSMETHLMQELPETENFMVSNPKILFKLFSNNINRENFVTDVQNDVMDVLLWDFLKDNTFAPILANLIIERDSKYLIESDVVREEQVTGTAIRTMEIYNALDEIEFPVDEKEEIYQNQLNSHKKSDTDDQESDAETVYGIRYNFLYKSLGRISML